jgi:hypothetical protein
MKVTWLDFNDFVWSGAYRGKGPTARTRNGGKVILKCIMEKKMVEDTNRGVGNWVCLRGV